MRLTNKVIKGSHKVVILRNEKEASCYVDIIGLQQNAIDHLTFGFSSLSQQIWGTHIIVKPITGYSFFMILLIFNICNSKQK